MKMLSQWIEKPHPIAYGLHAHKIHFTFITQNGRDRWSLSSSQPWSTGLYISVCSTYMWMLFNCSPKLITILIQGSVPDQHSMFSSGQQAQFNCNLGFQFIIMAYGAVSIGVDSEAYRVFNYVVIAKIM